MQRTVWVCLCGESYKYFDFDFYSACTDQIMIRLGGLIFYYVYIKVILVTCLLSDVVCYSLHVALKSISVQYLNGQIHNSVVCVCVCLCVQHLKTFRCTFI